MVALMDILKYLKRQRFDGTMCGVRDQIVSWLKLHFAQATKSYYQRVVGPWDHVIVESSPLEADEDA